MKKWTLEEKEGYTLVRNEGGATLSFDPKSGIQLLEDDGFAFKDLNRNGLRLSIFPSIKGLFQRVSSSCQVAEVLEFQLQHQSFQ